MKQYPLYALSLACLIISACGGSSNEPPAPQVETRSFAMGFTPWPYDATTTAVDYVYDEIAARGDIIAHHLDAGIPWQEALDQSAYPTAVEGELSTRLANTPSDKLVYLTVSPFNSARDNLADYWNNAGTGQTLTAPWNSRDFDSAEVIQAYINFAKDMINRFDPDYFNLGLEASELAINDLTRFAKFVSFTQQVAASLRSAYPDLKLMVSVAMKSPGSINAGIINMQMPSVIQHIDVVGVSIYPYVFFDHADKGDPANLPSDWLSQIETISAGKPLAITETGWVAERLQIPTFSVDVMATEDNQNAYLSVLFEQAQTLQMEFIIWFAIVDYDALWNGVLAQDPVAHIWRDTGLYDQNLNARAALSSWQQQLAISLATP